MGTSGNAHGHLLEHGKLFGRRHDLWFNARRRKEKVDVHGALAVSSESYCRDATRLFLLEQHSHDVAATLQMKDQLFGSSVAIGRDSNVDVTRRTRLGASRYSEAANQRTGHTRVVKLRKNALQRALDGV